MNEKQIVIFANGDLPHAEKLRPILAAASQIIAADGGLRHLEKMGIPPHMLVCGVAIFLLEKIQLPGEKEI